MEQSDKKRKFLSDITNTHDKPINRNDKGLIISPKEMLPKLEGRDDKENYDKNACKFRRRFCMISNVLI